MDKPEWADQQIDWMLNSLEHWQGKYGFNEGQCAAVTKLEAAVVNGSAGGLSRLADPLIDYLTSSNPAVRGVAAD